MNQIKFLNLTPHTIVLNDGTTYESEGVARVGSSFTEFNEFGLCQQVLSEVEGLPEQEDGVLLIVSFMVLDASDREDLVAPATGHPDVVRNEKGQIQSVPGFIAKEDTINLCNWNKIMSMNQKELYDYLGAISIAEVNIKDMSDKELEDLNNSLSKDETKKIMLEAGIKTIGDVADHIDNVMGKELDKKVMEQYENPEDFVKEFRQTHIITGKEVYDYFEKLKMEKERDEFFAEQSKKLTETDSWEKTFDDTVNFLKINKNE